MLKNNSNYVNCFYFFCKVQVRATSFQAQSIPLSDTRIEQRGLIAWICPDQKQEVSLFNASDSSVEEIVGTQVRSKRQTKNEHWLTRHCPAFSFTLPSFLPGPSHWKSLFRAQVVTVETIQQILKGNESLCICQASSHSGNIVSFNSLQLEKSAKERPEWFSLNSRRRSVALFSEECHRWLTAPATWVRASSQDAATNWPDLFFTMGWVSLCLLRPS